MLAVPAMEDRTMATQLKGDEDWSGFGDVDDVVYGGSGSNEMRGNDGRDEPRGAEGDEIIIGGRGADDLYGNGDNDYLYGGSGMDELYGGDGNDELWGGTWSDYLFGGAGKDKLLGGDDLNEIDGGDGDDIIWNSRGYDTIDGGDGDDTVIFDYTDMNPGEESGPSQAFGSGRYVVDLLSDSDDHAYGFYSQDLSAEYGDLGVDTFVSIEVFKFEQDGGDDTFLDDHEGHKA